MPEKKHTIQKRLGLVSLGLLGLAFLAVTAHDTWSIYTNEALSGGNTLQGGSIDLAAVGDSDNPASPAAIAPGGSVEYGGSIENQGANDLRYHSALATTGDADVCAALQVSALRDDSTEYMGDIAGLGFVDGSPLSAGDDEPWLFIFSLPADAVLTTDLSCTVRFPFTAWQALFLTPGLGWDDEAAFADLILVVAEGGSLLRINASVTETPETSSDSQSTASETPTETGPETPSGILEEPVIADVPPSDPESVVTGTPAPDSSATSVTPPSESGPEPAAEASLEPDAVETSPAETPSEPSTE